MPGFNKLDESDNQVRAPQGEMSNDDVGGLVGPDALFFDLAMDGVDGFEDGRSAWQIGERIAQIECAAHRSHGGSQVCRVNAELRKCRNAKQAGGVIRRDGSGQAGDDVPNLGSIEHVEAFDGEGNTAFGEFADQFGAMTVNAGEDGEVAPPAALFFASFLNA